MEKQAVAYINYRVIDLISDSGILVQHRFADINHFITVIEGLKNSKNSKKKVLGYENKSVLIDIEDVCIAKEYGMYMSRKYIEIDFKYGRRMLPLLDNEYSFDKVINDELHLDNVDTNKPLSPDRKIIKGRLDELVNFKEKPRKRYMSTDTEKMKAKAERNLKKVLEFAKLHNLSINKEDYKSMYVELEWKCSKCDKVFVATYKVVKNRKKPCKKCSKRKE